MLVQSSVVIVNPEPKKKMPMRLASSNLWALIPCEVWVKTLKPFTENLARENHIKLARELRERDNNERKNEKIY
jgi:hypothetical protein